MHLPVDKSVLLRHLPVLHMEEGEFLPGLQQDAVQMFAVGVGDEYLPEGIAGHEFHNLCHPVRVQFVEYVVQQQDGREAVHSFQEVELRQLERCEVGLVLPLRAYAFDGISA